MEHIISKVLQHSSVRVLSPKDLTTGVQIVEQLEKDCKWDEAPSYLGCDRYKETFQNIKTAENAVTPLYYTIVYMEAYTDVHQQEFVSQILYLPYGYWRYHSVGLGNGSTHIHWRAYGWSTQKQKTFPTYEDLHAAHVSSKERDAGIVAHGCGKLYAEPVAFPPEEMILASNIQDWSVGVYRYIYDPVDMTMREQEARKRQLRKRVLQMTEQ